MALSFSPRALGRGIGSSTRKIPGSVVLSVAVLVVVAICVVFPSVLVPGALDQNLALGVSPAGTAGHLLGTDKVGRDVLALTVAGARSAIVGPIVIAVGSMVAGLIFGMSAAWRGGLWDACVSRSCEVLLSLPVTLLAIVVAGVIGGSYWVTVGVLIVLFAPSDVRMIRSATLAQKPQPYIEATRVLGLSGPRILAVHILPNITPIVWANLFVNIAFALVSLSGLSYLGLGVGAQDADWGRQLADGRVLLSQNPAASVTAGLAIIVTATAINIAGDWFADHKERDL
ncbi:ABC transporter permease [Schaalia odontolytica]|uniref:Glutathione transport system permease protein gsiD n=1 Tax=Schaalia odontolytica TaxID=1660 RepID=A0A2X0UCG3_9ACTO|nr:ABC transporter permease [Schaalia odontolytica]WMS27652.1 ABC transporter permease [Schaalia odontolytica]SPT54818.1 Glutathione transport system permease protein gsiD [Schaalia odontolytica]